MSRVFVADETSLGRKVVVKVLPPELAAAVNVERFRREIQLAAKLQHPHIVPLLAAGISNGLPYYTMPFVTGESLRARLSRTRELPVAEVVKILRDVLSALSCAHEQGIVHRDIKPDNVLLTRQHAVVTDFGVAKALSAATNSGTGLTSIGVALGTPAYMAPEQASADPSADHRADLYAVAAMGYEMLTGYKVFSDRSPQQMLAAHATEVPEPVEKRRPATPAALGGVIMRALEKNPADRPQSADEMLGVLDGIGTTSGFSVAGTPSPLAGTGSRSGESTTPARRFSRKALVGAATAALLLLAGAIGVSMRGRSATPGIDRNLIVVTPFRVAGAQPSLAYLREGMLDLLAAKLTGEGGPRAADPRSVLSAWRKIASSEGDDLSRNETVQLAANLGAGRVILGDIVGTPSRMVVNAAVYEVPSGQSLRGEVSVQGPADSLASLVDQLTIQLLSLQSGEDQQHLADLASASLPALREYLEGKVLYRRGRYEAATTHFSRALDIDSTFALAAVSLVTASSWADSPLREKGIRLAWASREKLSVRDQIFLRGHSGPDPSRGGTMQEMLAARDSAVKLSADQPEYWYEYGDMLFHNGGILGIADSFERAEAAFGRALAIDSSFAPAIEHMVELAAKRGDLDDTRRFEAMYLKLDSAADHATYIRWRAAVALGDSAALRGMRPGFDRLDNANARRIAGMAMREGFSLGDADLALAMRADSTPGVSPRPQAMRRVLAYNRGYPAKAAQLQSEIGQQRRDPEAIRILFPLLSALFWDGDTTGTGAAVRGFSRFASVAPRTLQEQARQHMSACGLAVWRLEQRDVQGAATLIPVLERTLVGARSEGEITVDSECLLYVRAAVAIRLRQPNAAAALETLNRAVQRGGEDFFHGATTLLVARLYGETGDNVRALAAIRRRPYHWAGPTLAYLSTYLRDEGRFGTLAGDTAGAIRAYRHYLALRANPEPSLVPQRDSIRKILEGLNNKTDSR